MTKNTKIATSIVILLIIGLLSVVVLGSKNKKETTPPVYETPVLIAASSNAPIFFYGNTCPHCQEVENWLKENKIEGKISIVKKEVYENKTNALELTKAAKECGMDTGSIGVPFLFTPEKKCLVGTPDIINYLSLKAK